MEGEEEEVGEGESLRDDVVGEEGGVEDGGGGGVLRHEERETERWVGH